MLRKLPTAMVCLIVSVAAFVTCPAPAAEAKPKSNPVTLLGAGTRPVIAADAKGVLYAVFERMTGQAQSELVCTRSTDGGKTWSAANNIGPAGSATGSISRTSIAVESGGAVDVLWCVGPGANSAGIHFCRSCDGGTTWSASIDPTNIPTNNLANNPVNVLPHGLDNGQGFGCTPALALGPDDAIHIVWIGQDIGGQNSDVFYCQSKDGGKSFSPGDNIRGTPSSFASIASQPSVVVSEDGGVHVVWLDTTGGADHAVVSYKHWTGDLLAASNNAAAIKVSPSARISSRPVLAAGSGGRLYIVWTDNSSRPDSADVWYVQLGKRGKLPAATNLSLTTGVPGNPVVCADRRGRLAIVWSDTSTGRPNIFARFSRDSLGNVSYALDLSRADAGGPCKEPSVALLGASAYVIWEQEQGHHSLVNMTSLNFKDIATGILF